MTLWPPNAPECRFARVTSYRRKNHSCLARAPRVRTGWRGRCRHRAGERMSASGQLGGGHDEAGHIQCDITLARPHPLKSSYGHSGVWMYSKMVGHRCRHNRISDGRAPDPTQAKGSSHSQTFTSMRCISARYAHRPHRMKCRNRCGACSTVARFISTGNGGGWVDVLQTGSTAFSPERA